MYEILKFREVCKYLHNRNRQTHDLLTKTNDTGNCQIGEYFQCPLKLILIDNYLPDL